MTLLQPRWEYLVVSKNLEKDTKKPDNSRESLGKKGWELVTFEEETGYIFKRRVIG